MDFIYSVGVLGIFATGIIWAFLEALEEDERNNQEDETER